MSENLQDLFAQQGLDNPFSSPQQGVAPEQSQPSEPYSYQGDIAPTFEEAERIAQSKYNVSNHNALMGTLVSAGVEIGSGIGGTIYATKVMKGLKYANRAKNVALAGVVAPEPVSTAVGAVTFAASEAAIWGFSNFLGQTARKSFGIQEHYSGGEMIAAAVFGTAAATAQTTKLIELAPSLASMKAWKSVPVARETGKAFITGASLGVAESLLRQEVQLVLNERENRDVMDYMFSGAAGGTFNTVFSVFGRTGAWGLTKAGDAAQNARQIAEEKLEQAHKIKRKGKREKEVQKWTQAITHLNEVETSFRGAAKAEKEYHTKAPEPEHIENPSGDPRQAPKLEPLEKPEAPATSKDTPEGEGRFFGNQSDSAIEKVIKYEVADAESKLKSAKETLAELEADGGQGWTKGAREELVDEIENVLPKRIEKAKTAAERALREQEGRASGKLAKMSDDDFVAQFDKDKPATPKETPEPTPAPTENVTTPDINPTYTRGSGQRRILGYKVKAKDGRELYIVSRADEAEVPKSAKFLVKMGDDGLEAFPTKKEALDWIDRTNKIKDPETPEATPAPKTPEGAPEAEAPLKMEEEAPEAPSPETEEPKLTERQSLIESYKERFKNIKGEKSLARQFAPLQLDTNKLKTELDSDFEWRIEELTAKYQSGAELSPKELDEMLELVSDLRSLNEVDNVLKTTAGRGVQANRSDAAKYVSSTDLSLRAIKEDSALFDMEETLLQLRRGEEAPNMESQMELFLKSSENTNKLNEAVYGNKELSQKDLDDLGVTKEEVEIQRRTASLLQKGVKTLTRQLEKERAKMMQGMKMAMNKHQKDKLAEEVEKRLKENPTIRMLTQQLEYYKGAEKELRDIDLSRKELARLSAIEGEGNMTQLRKETEVKDRVAADPTELSKIRKQIVQSKARMRQKLKEIDKAQEEINNPVSFAEKRVTKLEKELKKLQEIRSGQRSPDSPKTPDAVKTKKELDLEARIKFYKDEVREISQLEKKEAELARLTNLEADGRLGQIRDEFTTKPKIVGEPTGKIADINKKIADSKSRMRSKLKDIDRARAEMDKFDLFLSMQAHAMRNIEADSSSKLVQFGRDLRAARKLALIDQLPSIMAGVPTGIGLAMRSAIRPFAMAPLDFARYGGDTATQLFMAELKGVATTIMNWNGTATSMGRTFQRGSSATDQVMSKYLEESSHKAIRMGNTPSLDRAMKTAEARVRNQRDPMNTILDFRNNGGWALLSLGVRGIGAIDDGFRRQILRGRLETAARRKAIMEHPTDAKLAEETYNNYMKTMWKEQNGLQVLHNYKEFIDDVNDINQNLLFAAQGDNPELFHQNAGEQLIKALSGATKGDNSLAYLVDAFMPYISVPIRGVYRGARFAASPLVGAKAISPMNPYSQKIAQRKRDMEVAQAGMLNLKDNDPNFKGLADEVKNKQSEINILREREIKYREDAMVDLAFGGGLVTLGFSAALAGEATGSLNWMSDDQKEKNKLTPFNMFGMDYSAAAPWSIPMAIGADMAQYIKAREAGVLKDNQNVLFMMSSTLVELSEQVPMMQGLKTFQAILAGGMETKGKLLGRMAAGYVPIPAQIRKTLMAMDEDGTIGDLRGGTFQQRASYAFFGTKPINRKTDYFGEDLKSGKTWVQQAVIRQAPSEDTGLQTEFERVLASDAFDNIQAPPSSMGHRMKMTSFIDDDGVTLQYAYALRLRDHRKVYKGKKRTLKEAVNHLIRSNKWKNKHKEATISKSLQHNNEGLRELNKLMQDYYFDVRESIIDDDKFTKRFVNNREENLFDLVRRKDTKILGNIRPIRELLQAN